MAGIAGYRLTDGNCIADRMVRAPGDRVAASLGTCVHVWTADDLIIEDQPEDARCIVATIDGWTYIEPTTAIGFTTPGDHLQGLFATGIAALAGRVPEPDLVYQNPLGVAARAARSLQTIGVALWGSGEWPGIMGGATVDADGIDVAISAYGPDEIAASIATRENFMARLTDPDLEKLEGPTAGDPLRWERSWRWSRDAGLEVVDMGARELLDALLIAVDVDQQEEPLDDWGAWDGYEDVWIVRDAG